MSSTQPVTAPDPGVRSRNDRTNLFALAGSAATSLIGLWWLLAPEGHPLTDGLLVVLRFLDPAAAAAVLVGAGAATCALGLLAHRLPAVRPVSTVVGLVFALLLITVFQGPQLIMMAGYLVALAVPAGLVLLLVQGLRRYPKLRPVLVLLVAGAAAWCGVMGVFDESAPLVRLVTVLLPLLGPQVLALLAPVVLLATGAAWLAAGWSEVRETSTAVRLATFVREHRTLFTVIAAACPLPYLLLRLTWLTPAALFVPLDLTADMRLWGLLLGGAALVGSVLTVGLIRPWGEVFPRWMPVVAGRTVPVAAAAAPGFTVAALIGTAGVAMLFSQFPGSGLTLSETLFTAVVFPFWLWGPTLALAVAGYVGHRRVAG